MQSHVPQSSVATDHNVAAAWLDKKSSPFRITAGYVPADLNLAAGQQEASSGIAASSIATDHKVVSGKNEAITIIGVRRVAAECVPVPTKVKSITDITAGDIAGELMPAAKDAKAWATVDGYVVAQLMSGTAEREAHSGREEIGVGNIATELMAAPIEGEPKDLIKASDIPGYRYLAQAVGRGESPPASIAQREALFRLAEGHPVPLNPHHRNDVKAGI